MERLNGAFGLRKRNSEAALKLALEPGEMGLDTSTNIIWVRSYAGLYFPITGGVTSGAFSTLAEAAAEIGLESRTLIVDTVLSVPVTFDFAAACPNCSIRVSGSGGFDTAAGQTLTIPQPEAGLYQIYFGTGTVIYSKSDIVRIEHWGAESTPYNTTPTFDCAPALRAAIAAIHANGGTIRILDRQYAFGSQIAIDTNGIGSIIRITGLSDWRSVLYYTGTESPALKFGIRLNPDSNPEARNSGLVDLENIHISGSGSTGEVDAIQISCAQRYTHWDKVRIRGFKKGVGLDMYWIFTTDWGTITVDQCYKALYGTVINAFNFKAVHVEICGPYGDLPIDHDNYYQHSTIPNSDPSVYMNGGGCLFGLLEIEGNLAVNACVIEDQVTILDYYSEGNYYHGTGNEIKFQGDKPALVSGLIYPRPYPSPPNPRYIISMGDSVGARVDNLIVHSNLGSETNTTFGVDFATSDNAIVNIFSQQYTVSGGISQETAYKQEFKGNLNRFEFNGKKYAAGMEVNALAKVLFENHSKMPLHQSLMQKPSSGSNVALGFSSLNLSADSILKKFPSPLGHGRVQKIQRSAASAAGVYFRIAAGTLDASHKYFISSYMYRDVATGSAQLRVLNGAIDQYVNPAPNITNWLGWQRASIVRTFANVAASALDIYPCYVNSSGEIHYASALFCIDLTEFDAVYGTGLADLPIIELEKILDPSVLSSEFREFSNNAHPVDGTYKRGDVIWYYPTISTTAGHVGAVCLADGTPGTWKNFGKLALSASATWDPANMAADGDTVSTTIAVSGSQTTDFVSASLSSIGANNVLISAHVQAAGTVRVTLMNKTGGALDIGSGTLTVGVTR